MQILFDETFELPDKTHTGRHRWYGGADHILAFQKELGAALAVPA